MEQMSILKQKSHQDTWSSKLESIEIASDFSTAIVEIPLMHVGPNKKGLFWTAEMLKEMVPLFKGVAFRYDLDGQEGSSHTTNKLSSPHFDVGWTYKEDGAWFDEKENIFWVKGEVTHPQVIQKLSRSTSDGQRELNYASMGVLVDEAKCSICGQEYGECEHVRLQSYNMEVCYKVPTKIGKALHAALTNDPADGEAEIAKCIFQEMGGNMNNDKKPNPFDKKSQDVNKKPFGQPKEGDQNNYEAAPRDMQNQAADKNQQSQPGEKKPEENQQTQFQQNQLPGGLATSSPQTEQPGMAPSPQTILKDLAERVKTLEQKIMNDAMENPRPELINAAPQDKMTQDNMGVTSQFEEEQQKVQSQPVGEQPINNQEESQMVDKSVGQVSNEKVPVNPKKPEMADGSVIAQAVQLLQQAAQLLSSMGGMEMQDMGKEAMDASKGMVKEPEKPMEHAAPGDAVSVEAESDESNKKNKQHMTDGGSVATADNSEKKDTLKEEVADLSKTVKALAGRIELQDNDVPEFGGVNNTNSKLLEAADMSADERHSNFGEFGKWDACFRGTASANKFKR